MLEGRNWHGMSGASEHALAELRALAPEPLPESYLALLASSDGGEGPLPVSPFNLCLDPVKEVVERLANANCDQPEFGGFLIFGGNGGGEYLAFDMRDPVPWPVVTIDMVAGRASAERVASNFDHFVKMIGLEAADQ